MRLGISLSLTQPLGGFSPASLFSGGQQGAWYDPSDLTTLFQDAAGTTPVTTPGQTVALVLDKSQGLVLGPELVTNGTFNANSSAGWTLNTWTVANNRLEKTAGDTLRASGTLTSALVSGRYYKVTLDAFNFATACNVLLRTGVGGTSSTGYSIPSGSATHSFVMQATDAHTVIQFFPSSTGFSGNIDNISVRELPGFHATQSTAASRPTYGIVPATGRRNLLTYTEEIGTSPWGLSRTTVTANAATAPNGTLTADALVETATTGKHYAFIAGGVSTSSGQSFTFSAYVKQFGSARRFSLLGGSVVFGDPQTTTNNGASFDLSSQTVISQGANVTSASISAVGDGWYRVVCTMTTLANGAFDSFFCLEPAAATTRYTTYTGDGISGILIWGVQLETGSTATNYQRVGSAFDVTEAGVPSLSYLFFDGVDDFLVTPTITPNIDKAQVFAGVRKLSDAAVGIIYESSVNSGLNAGTIQLYNATDLTIQGRARGSNDVSLITSALSAAPLSFVATLQGDIAGDTSSIRVNGVSRASSSADQGTGNYLAYPIYIGRRGGTTLPFNGQIYSLIVRFGANLDAGTISNTETWVNGKTGAY